MTQEDKKIIEILKKQIDYDNLNRAWDRFRDYSLETMMAHYGESQFSCFEILLGYYESTVEILKLITYMENKSK